MAKRPKPPIMPPSAADPTGVDRIERGAMRAMDRKLSEVLRFYRKMVLSLPVSGMAINARYEFLLDETVLTSLFSNLDSFIDQVFLEGGPEQIWLFSGYVEKSYQRGTAQEYANLKYQSSVYAAGTESLASLMSKDYYRRRVALVNARVFEEMKGLSGDLKANMGRILSDGIGRGQNPRNIAQRLSEQLGLEKTRAHRIARTEVTTALRRARMDEAEDATERYGLMTRQLHISALSPTTRRSHADRHGTIFTVDQQRDWWSVGANSINCKCTTVTILVDSKGQPLVPGIIDRTRQKYLRMREQSKAEWAEAA